MRTPAALASGCGHNVGDRKRISFDVSVESMSWFEFAFAFALLLLLLISVVVVHVLYSFVDVILLRSELRL